MTIPHLMNCDHSEDGWCIPCVKELHGENERLTEELAASRRRLEAVVDKLRAIPPLEDLRQFSELNESGERHVKTILKVVRAAISAAEGGE